MTIDAESHERASTTESEPLTAIRGGCFCGAVRYEASEAPLGSMICHCQTCRRIAGAPVVPWLTFTRPQFRLLGAAKEFSSSAGVHRTFCSSCGSPITYRSDKTPDEIDVATCTLDDPNAFPPTHHSWLSDDLRWVKFGDGLPSCTMSRYGS